MKKNIFSILFILFTHICFAQSSYLQQYFDGADTNYTWSSIKINIDTLNHSNIWQIGSPHKIIFDSAATRPNALITDTINFYPKNDSSKFTFNYYSSNSWGILALRWKQKLDFEKHKDGGIIEYSQDTGKTWVNCFNDPHVYNFYGFGLSNKDTLPNGEYAFSGTDSSWKDIWLCFDRSWISSFNQLTQFRFRIISDSVQTNQEGWMIDNMNLHITIFHTIGNKIQQEYLKIYPTITSGQVNIETKKTLDYNVIEYMELIDINGKMVERFGLSPTKYYINISNHPNGVYYLKVVTTQKTETHKIVLQK